MSKGLIALLVVASFDLLGAIYYRHLQTNPFPSDIVRPIPAIWFAGLLLGGVLAARALRSESSKVPGGLALVLCVPSLVMAWIFALAALVGD
jgi:hypothetical protein